MKNDENFSKKEIKLLYKYNSLTKKLKSKCKLLDVKSNLGHPIYLLEDNNSTIYLNYLTKVTKILDFLMNTNNIDLSLSNVISTGFSFSSTLLEYTFNEKIDIDISYIMVINNKYIKNDNDFYYYHELGHCLNDHSLNIISEYDDLNNFELSKENTINNLTTKGNLREAEADRYALNHNCKYPDIKESVDCFYNSTKSIIKANDKLLKNNLSEKTYNDLQIINDERYYKYIYENIEKQFNDRKIINKY